MPLTSELWRPLLEIAIIWFVLYTVFRFIQGTRTVQVLMGLIVIAIFFHVARFLELTTINWVLTKLFAIGIFALLIIFQPELRRALTRLGQHAVLTSFFQTGGVIDEVVKACEVMSRARCGALIAIERDVGLKNYIESGVLVDSQVTSELLLTIFYPNTPLHDGGIIIRGDRVASAGSLFPLTQSVEVSKTLGTRHRAAIGLTEETDAVCILVSEETGSIAVAVQGKLKRDLDGDGLLRVLKGLFRPEERPLTFTTVVRSLGLDKMVPR